MKKYRCIIFDWDGTLMDSAKKISECVRAAATDADLPVPTEQQARNIIGLGLTEAMRELFGDIGDEKVALIIERYKHHFLMQNVTEQPMFSGVLDGLEELSFSGAFLAVATGKSRAGLNRVLESESMQDVFIYTRCADESRSKPHPQMLLDICEFIAIEPKDCLMVGDTEYDMQMASNAGIDAVGVSYGVHDEQRLRSNAAIYVASTVKELMQWLMPRVEPAFGDDYDD